MFNNSKYKIHQARGFNFLKVSADGAGLNTLVCLHGMFGGLSNFDFLIGELDGYSIYVPDIPLYSLPKSKLSISGLAGWLRQFTTKLNIKDPVLLGNSMGGHVALEYTLQHPGYVRGLILTGSSGLFENDFGSTRPRRNDRDYIRKQANLTFYDDLVDDTMIDEILDVIQSPAKLIRLLWIARSTRNYNMEDELARIFHHTLLVWGKNDIITPPEVAETFYRKMPNASLKWIDKCGHAPMMERPKQFVRYMKEFLTELEHKNLTRNPSSTKYEKDYSHL